MAVGGAACPTLPGDLALLEKILAACAGRLAVMSVSPDTPNILPVIRRLRAENVTVFLTHTRAKVEETEAALDAGAVHATHFYDVFYAPAETEPGARPVGAVEAILADPRASVDFIADGVHVHPTAIRAAVAAKTWAGVILITDSNVGAGLPPGVYDTPWGYRVKVSPGDAARHETKNFLAGSALTMDRGMANLLQWLKLPPAQVWAMGTLNPARLLGLGRKGRLEVGADADLVLWEENLTAARTWVAGHSVYEKK
jgi:N-acetylglucosamine-6-phosphate deacetylase